jgi:hypothetical protein
MAYTENDICVRMTNLQCYIGNFVYGYSIERSKGKTSKCKENKIRLLRAYYDTIHIFDINNQEEGCINEESMDIMFDSISDITGLCFNPKGT